MTQLARPDSTSVASHGFNGATMHGSLNDESDSTEVFGNASPASWGTLQNLTDPVSSTGHELQLRVIRSSGTGVPTVQIWQGDPTGAGTLIFSTSVSAAASVTEQVYPLSGAEADAITNYNDLNWLLDKTGGTATWDLFELRFAVPDAPVPPTPVSRVIVVGL